MMQRLIVFQQAGQAEAKIAGIEEYGKDLAIVAVHDLPQELPQFLDDPSPYFPGEINGDLVLSFLKHPDLADHLARLCQGQGIPLVASGVRLAYGHCPFTCCGLGRHPSLGAYGRCFGFPELEVTTDTTTITSITVHRGASCGATWEAAEAVTGMAINQALADYPRLVQYLCQADPSRFDPVSGKSSVHYAGHVHHAALLKAIQKKQAAQP